MSANLQMLKTEKSAQKAVKKKKKINKSLSLNTSHFSYIMGIPDNSN